MITVREYILFPVLLGSEKWVSLRDHEKLFYIRLGCATDGAGRFDADAALLRAALYPKELHKVSERDVKGLLMRMHQVGLVRLYTQAGKGYGEVTSYKQRDSQRKVRYPEPDAGEMNFASMESAPADDPSPRSSSVRKKNRIEGKGMKKVAEATAAQPPNQFAGEESTDAWIARLSAAWPSLDIASEVQKAITKKAKSGEQLERGWFEQSWLTKCTPVVTRGEVFRVSKAQKAGEVANEQPEPEGWREVIKDSVYGPGEENEVKSWAELPVHVKAWVREQLEKRNAA